MQASLAENPAVRFLTIPPASDDELSLVPYVKRGGEWTLPDSAVKAAAEASRLDGTFKTVFYDGGIKTADEFLAMMQLPTNQVVFAVRGTDLIGFGWLNNIAGNRAFCHFCFLRPSWGKDAVPAARMILDYWMSFQGAKGPLLDVLLGAVALHNVRAIQFATKVGGVQLGVIPRMICDYYAGAKVPAAIIYYLRK